MLQNYIYPDYLNILIMELLLFLLFIYLFFIKTKCFYFFGKDKNFKTDSM